MFFLRLGTQSAADDTHVAHIEFSHIQRGGVTGERRRHDPLAHVRHIRQTFAHDLTVETVDGEVHRVSLLVKLLHNVNNAFGFCVDNAVGTGFSDKFPFALVDDGRDDTGAESFCHGDDHAGKSAGTSEPGREVRRAGLKGRKIHFCLVY